MKTSAKLVIGTTMAGISLFGLYKSNMMILTYKDHNEKEQNYANMKYETNENAEKILKLNIPVNEKIESIESLLHNLPQMTVEELNTFDAKEKKEERRNAYGAYLMVLSTVVAFCSLYSSTGYVSKLRNEHNNSKKVNK